MKITDARPCDSCKGPLCPGMNATFYIVRVTQAMINRQQAQRDLGGIQFMGGSAQLADAMGMTSDDGIIVFGEKDKNLWTELFLCFDCAVKPKACLPELIERRTEELQECQK